MVRYYVFDHLPGEQCLGYIDDRMPTVFQILFYPGRSPLDNTLAAPLDESRLCEATKEDFNRFRVSWKGHLE